MTTSSSSQQSSSSAPPEPPSAAKNAVYSPQRWLHMYGDFITKNAHQVSQIESALRSLTYIIPGPFFIPGTPPRDTHRAEWIS